MTPTRNDTTLQEDNRAVAPVIGFILIFAILVLAFVQYQAQVVPQQNAETEFEHFQEHQNEMVELRSAILTAGTDDRDQFPTVQLGTTYQVRTFALNGPPPAGTLKTTKPYLINISDESGNDATVKTRFLEYQPGYFEIDVGSTWYENSVLYLEEGPTDAERVFIEDQSLINKGTLQITALQNKFQRTGTDRVTLELRTLEDETVGDLSVLKKSDNLTVEMPTRLERNYWHDQLNDSDVVVDVGDSTPLDSDFNRQNLTVDNVTVNSVGIRDAPDEDPQKDIDPITGGSGDGGSGDGGSNNYYPDTFTVNSGSVTGFANMQNENTEVTDFNGEGGGGSSFDIDVITNTVPAGDYILEISVEDGSSFQGGGASVTVTDENGEIGSGTISSSGLFTLDLDSSVEGAITVKYTGNNQNTNLDIGFQRLV